MSGGSLKRKLLLVVVLAALGVGGYYGGRALGLWGEAAVEDARIYGNVEIREVDLGFRVGGRIASLAVDEGDAVIEGSLLATLDTRPIEDRIAAANAQIAIVDTDVERQANGARPEDIAIARQQLAEAQAALTEAERQLARRAALLDRGFVSKADFQAAEAQATAMRARVQSASSALQRVEAGDRREDRARTRAQRDAIATERRAAETDLADTRLYAASSGVVVTRAVENGAIVQPGQTVFTLAISRPVRVRAWLPEPWLSRVRPGQRLEISVDGIEQRLSAVVAHIAPGAEFTPKTVQTERQRTDLVYRVRLTVDDPQNLLRQGQPVTVHLPAAARGSGAARADAR